VTTPLPPTTSQTVGPFFAPALLRADARINDLTTPATQGERIRVTGRVLDGDGQTVPDAMVEVWQANAAGRYNHPADTRDLPLDRAFIGFGRSGTEEGGRYWFDTVRPGPVPFSDGVTMQAPHLNIAVFARGLLNHANTRIYFADDPATGDDPVLARVPAERRATLLAAPSVVDGLTLYTLDIVLQGVGETVFFDFIRGVG
jgi:protocatechuate 3,4-dioxygenase alpha subunit